MKRIVSAALLLMMLLAFTACDKAQTPTQNPSPSATETPTLEITQETAAKPTITPTATFATTPTSSHALKDVVLVSGDGEFDYQWQREDGAGDPDHISEALERVVMYDSILYSGSGLSYSDGFTPTEYEKELASKLLSEHLRNILWDLDVYVAMRVLGTPLADKYDEEGNWVAVDCNYTVIEVTIIAGDTTQRDMMTIYNEFYYYKDHPDATGMPTFTDPIL